MGPQFAHLQSFSRKANPAGQSVGQVLGELMRDPEFSYHVKDPKPVTVVDGISPDQLRVEHDAMIKRAATAVNVKGEVRMRAVRRDRHTLLTAVVSYPLTWDEIEQDPKEQVALKDWEAANVKFFKDHFGAHYRATYSHTDEPRPHLHIYGLPEGIDGVDATLLHPGKAAKKSEEARRKAAGDKPREVVAAGNRALRASMRGWQDAYYQQVGAPCGLLRVGPKRQRLSRAQYNTEKQIARQHRESELESRRLELVKATRIALQEAKIVRENNLMLEAQWEELQTRKREQQRYEEELHTTVKLIQSAAKRLRAVMTMVAAFLGAGAARDIHEGLTAIEHAAEKAQKIGVADDSEPDDIMAPT